jgi:ORF6N domain
VSRQLARRRPTAAQRAVEERIRVIRGKHVVLDSDLADFYGVEVRVLTQAMKRNPERFPSDFVFQLNQREFDALRSQGVISKGRGGRRYRPYAFTEQGALQLSSVLRSPKAAQVSVAVARAFVTMRTRLHALEELPHVVAEIQTRLARLEASDADLNAQVELIAEGFEALDDILNAVTAAEKKVPQLEATSS